jgi:hypothetical protein
MTIRVENGSTSELPINRPESFDGRQLIRIDGLRGYRERMRAHPNRALPIVFSSLAKPRQAVTEAFFCEQIFQARLVRLVS